MRVLIEKEIRLLLPAFAAALALAIVPVWLLPSVLWHSEDTRIGLVSDLFVFGAVLLALSSFGREIGLRTLPFVLAQPLERARVWWTKIIVLVILLALACDAWWLSETLCSFYRPALEYSPKAIAFVGTMYVVFTAGGLWMTLLLRQTVAAFLLTFLIPIVAASTTEAFGATDAIILTGLGLYAVAAFFLARRQFLHLQDTAWTGGVVSITRQFAVTEASGMRVKRPWAALVRKELQLQQFTLAGVGLLFLLHLAAVGVRVAGAHVLSKNTLFPLQMFGFLWLFVPVLAGAQSVAEERQLGTLDGLLCLPVSRRLQFDIKLLFVVFIGGFLSTALLSVAENIASALGASANLGIMGIEFDPFGIIKIFFAFLALSLIGLFTSTLTRGLVPALAAGGIAATVAWLLNGIASKSTGAFGPHLWPFIAFPSFTMAVVWLAYRNFRWLLEGRRAWRRNLLGLIAFLVLTCSSTAAIYHRLFELVLPLDGSHGVARLPIGKPVSLNRSPGAGTATLAILPDGRLWVKPDARSRNGRDWNDFVLQNDFILQGKWAAACEIGSRPVGIRSDGTLWSLENGKWTQSGIETTWQSIQPEFNFGWGAILLKKDGTLWSWQPDHSRLEKGMRVLPESGPIRIGAESDWTRILRGSHGDYAWKRDGSAWVIRTRFDRGYRVDSRIGGLTTMVVTNLGLDLTPDMVAQSFPDLDKVPLRCIDRLRVLEIAVREDGTLCYWIRGDNMWDGEPSPETRISQTIRAVSPGLVQIGRDSDWSAVTSARYQVLALKTDGSLWRWKLGFQDWSNGQQFREAVHRALASSPDRLGTHMDWVGLGNWDDDTVALAADGSLWRWRRNNLPASWFREDDSWLAPSRRPLKIGNILDAPP